MSQNESEPAAPRRETSPSAASPMRLGVPGSWSSMTRAPFVKPCANMLGQSGYVISLAEDGKSGLSLADSENGRDLNVS